MSYRYETKPEGYRTDADYESANVAGVTAPGQYDSADDVFGNEDGAQVGEHFAFARHETRVNMYAKDSLSDHELAACVCPHDSRNCLKRNAQLAFQSCCGWDGTRCYNHFISGHFCNLYKLAADSIQVASSTG